MQLNVAFGLALAVVGAAAVGGCSDGRAALSPVSPSSLTSGPSIDAVGAGLRPTPRQIDSDGDGYDDGEAPEEMPDPGSEPMPNPEGVPLPDEGPAAIPLTINIIGPLGPGAFVPNPLQVALGDTIVWMNSDLIAHDIVLDDGTSVGNLAPGQSSLPISLAESTMVSSTIGYHCTLHPTMVGQVMTGVPGEPLPTDESQNPTPDPSGGEPAPTDPYPDPYGDGGYEY